MKISLLLICMCLGCSCVRKDISENVPISLNVSIASLRRAVNTLPDGAELGIYVAEDSPENNYNGVAYQNIHAVVAGGRLELDEDIMLSSTMANIYLCIALQNNFYRSSCNESNNEGESGLFIR